MFDFIVNVNSSLPPISCLNMTFHIEIMFVLKYINIKIIIQIIISKNKIIMDWLSDKKKT